MDVRRVRAVAKRIVLGFRRDRRSLGLLFAAPIIVLSLVGAVWGSTTERAPVVVIATDRFAGPPNVIDRFLSSSIIQGRRATAVQRAFVEGLTALGQVPGPRIVIEQLYGGSDYSLLDYLAPVLVAFFAFFFIFLLSAVSFLRERTTGTLERLMATPLRRGELVIGYLVGFSFFALLQALVILVFTVFVLQVHYRGNLATIFIVEAVLVVGAVSLGLLVSAAARNELQAVQFVPIVLLPQVFLSGLLIPVDQLPDYLRPFSTVLPLTYANEALRSVMIKGYELADPLVLRDIGILVAFGLVMAVGAVASIRREVA